LITERDIEKKRKEETEYPLVPNLTKLPCGCIIVKWREEGALKTSTDWCARHAPK